jgi:peptidoglycan/xylan/chitin deacetylase (PgdA/CDA1 family)
MLVKHGIPFHVFVPVGLVNETRQLQLSTNDIRTLSTNPLIGFGAHGLLHRSLTSLNDDELKRELSTSRTVLSELTECEVQSMSYPFGDHDDRVRNAARNMGFALAGTSSPGTCHKLVDPMQIPRIDIWAMDSPRDVLNKLRGAWDWLL